MSRRKVFLSFVAVSAMVALAALTFQQKDDAFPMLDWANVGSGDTPAMAVLIELGTKDKRTVDWSGTAKVTGGRVVHREGYRFRATDKLVAPNGWKAKSHLAIRAPRNPAIALLEGISTIGVVLHVRDLKPGANINIEIGSDGKKVAVVPFANLQRGKPVVLWQGQAVVRLVTTATPLSDGPTEDDFPAAAHAPDGTLWTAFIRYHIKEKTRRIESKALDEQPENFKDYYTPKYRDELVVRYLRRGKWSVPILVTSANEDLVRCAIAAEKGGDVWVFYSANRNGKYHIFAKKISTKFSPDGQVDAIPRVGKEIQVTKNNGPNLTPIATTDSSGTIHLAFQTWNPNAERFGIEWFQFDEGKLQVGPSNFQGEGNQWSPALAAGPSGAVACAIDAYDNGDYDTRLALGNRRYRAAGSTKYEVRPSMVFDAKGRLWIAYEEGPEQWGKDYGALDAEGDPLYSKRSVRVVCIENGNQRRPVADLPTSEVIAPRIPFDRIKTNKFERGMRYSSPTLGLDGKGRVWLSYRVKYGTRYSSHPGSYWISYVRMLEGDQWTPPIEIHHSDGLLDYRPVLLPHASGGLRILHNSDGRYTLPETVHNRIYASYVTLPGEPVEPKLVPHEPGSKAKNLTVASRQQVDRIRDYRVEAGGKSYRYLRGEFHRHTEVSWDGGADGSLEDMFRYALDAAAFDWIGNGDHDNGAGREYPWWLTQKLTDAYHVPEQFTPMFTYERSVSYPHGHRNCMFAKRGVRTLPRLAQPKAMLKVAGIHADDTKMLYRYLRELDGICAVHTSATGMGTDWRDNDPVVEPIVEIYQGDRMSYEKEKAPRAGYDPQSGDKPANIGGWRPKGYLDNAFAKGYRLGFQASSDHWSTHISYCIVAAESHDRKAILDAVKKRHVYGATDNIILAVTSGDHFMGDEFTTKEAPTLSIHVIGTGPLAKIDILKDSQVVHTLEADGKEYRGKWTDPDPTPGTHYYYVRVLQQNNEIAWGSPMWIDYKKP